MLGEKALQYRRQGYNCSQCIVKAAEQVYKLPVSRQVLQACQGINAGLGVGELCVLLLAGVMVFGLLFDELTTKKMRIRLLTAFSEKYPGMNCTSLLARRKAGDMACEGLIGEVADMMERIIAEENQTRR
ncbi:MAG: C-GCAxxG-C-C family protein [Firmicutes bacterium]|nr:C-GCAxxG-C-C family protein [Bacillota bacterium]